MTSTTTLDQRSAVHRVLTYATCVFAFVAWPFVPYAAAGAALLSIAFLALWTPASSVERWSVQAVATFAFVASVAVWFATPVGISG